MKMFYDVFGNLLPNSKDDFSENPTTFNCALYFSKVWNENLDLTDRDRTHELIRCKYYYNDYTWRTMEFDENPSWSLDEKISALAFLSFIGDNYLISKIPLFPSLSNTSKYGWLRPDVLAYTIGSKWPLFRFLMWPIVLIKLLYSEYRFNKDAKKYSSGMQLAFIMAMGWDKGDYVFSIQHDMELAFSIYYPEENHPINLEWRDN